jgi:hypothetical protein
MHCRGEVQGCNFEKIFMKFLKQKNVAVISLAFIMLFLGAQKGNAANCTGVLRTCYCFSDYANHTPVTSVSAVDTGCFQYKSGCEDKCKTAGYKSAALIDPAFPLNDGQTNGLNTISGMSAPSLKITKSTDGECDPSHSLLPCLCSNDHTNAVEIGCYTSREQCDPKCAEKNYKYAVLFNASYYSPHTMDNQPNANDSRNALHTLLTQPIPTPTPGGAQITNDIVPGTAVGESKIITCGRPGQHMCHLCDFIKGFYNIIKYIQGIAIGIALLAMAIGGIIYIVSAGESGLMETAKSAIKNAAIGFVIIFASYLIVNTTIVYLGTKTGLGINASWGTVDCNSTAVERTDQ